MTTKLDSQFLRAICLMVAFKPDRMRSVQAALLAIAINGHDFSAFDLPAELTNGDTHIAGAACGSLVGMGLIRVVDRIKSPNGNAKGRKLNVYRISMGKLETVRTWFAAQGLKPPSAPSNQMNLVAA